MSYPVGQKRAHFAQRQGARKDVERAFGVLHAGLAVYVDLLNTGIRRPCGEVMTCCVILHNMIVEDEGEDAVEGL